MSDVLDNVQLNPGAGGATIATDYVSAKHYQIVKTAYGADGTALDVTRTVHFPVSIEVGNGDYANPYLAVAGSTNGVDPVRVNVVSGTLSVDTVGVSGGTLNVGYIVDGVSADIRSIADDVKVGVHTLGVDTVTVTDGVILGSPVDDTYIGEVDIRNTTLPGSLTIGQILNLNATMTLLLGVNGTYPLQSGVRVKNVGDSNAPILLIGTADATSTGFYHLAPGENIFLEINNINLIKVKTDGSVGAGKVSWIGS